MPSWLADTRRARKVSTHQEETVKRRLVALLAVPALAVGFVYELVSQWSRS
jgi:hypothetical protein